MENTTNDINNIISENKIKDFNERREISPEKLIRIFKKRKKIILIIFFTVFTTVGLHTIYMRIFNPIFLGKFTLLISDPLNKNIDNIYKSLDEDDLATAFGDTKTDTPTLMKFLKSSYILSPVAEKFNIETENLQKKLKIIPYVTGEKTNRPEYSGILEVKYFSKSPKKELSLLEELSYHFINSAKKFKENKLINGLKFLESQEPGLQEKVIKVQNRIKIFRQQNSILEPNIEGTLLRNQETDYLTRIRNLDEIYDNLRNIKNEITSGKYFISGFDQNIVTKDDKFGTAGYRSGLQLSTSYQTLVEEFNKIENELSLLRSKYKPNSKLIKSFEKRSNAIKPALKKYQLEAVEAALSFNRTQRKTLEEQRKLISNLFQKQPSLINEYQSLLSRLDLLEKNLTSLIGAKEEFQLQLAKDNVAWTIIEPASFSSKPIFPSIKRRLASAVLFGLFFSLLTALYFDIKDLTFKDEKNIRDRFNNFSYIGFINYMESFSEIINTIGLPNFFSPVYKIEEGSKIYYQRKILRERLSNIYASINFLFKTKSKVFLITSTQSLEGKSVLSTLISLTFSEMGKKILLIDADLRKPKLNEYLNLKAKEGLSDFLISDKNIDEYYQSFKSYPNLNYLSPGLKYTDPPKLLSSQKFKDTIKNLRESEDFDYIFINTAPAIGIAESIILTPIVDRVIFVISVQNVAKDLSYEAIKILVKYSKYEPLIISNVTKKIDSLVPNYDQNSLNYYIN